MTPGPWAARLSAAAEADLAGIARWTVREFGARQAEAYVVLLLNGLDPLGDGPLVPGSADRADIGPGLRSLRPRKSRHVLVHRADPARRVIEIVRILHDSMDPARHLPGDDPGRS